METIALCMIVRNEAQNLAEGLADIVGLFDEVVVVDNGSDDGTAEVARQMGCKVIHAPEANLDEGRQIYVQEAQANWIFVLDGDERVYPDGISRLREDLASMDKDVARIVLPRYEYIGNGRWAGIRLYRLFRNDGRVRYERSAVHASVVPVEGVVVKDVRYYLPIHHLDVLQGQRSELKRERNVRRILRQLEETPHNVPLHCYLSLEYVAMGDYGEARRCLENALEIDASHPFAWHLLGKLYLDQGDDKEAEAVFSKIIASNNPHRERNLTCMAEIMLRRNDLQAAELYAEKAIKADQWWAHGYLNLGAVKQAMKKYDEAIALLQRAIGMNPYIVKPIIYKTGARRNLFTIQDALLSIVRNVAIHLAECYTAVGARYAAEHYERVAVYLTSS